MAKNYILLLSGALLLSSCAPKNWSVEEEGAYDPVEPINRAMYQFNKKVDWAVLTPAAKAYSHLPPSLLRGLGNAFRNLKEPANAANNLLQNRGDESAMSATRFLINSTVGLGGFFDFAKCMNIEAQPADFDQTLRSYGEQYGEAKIRRTAIGRWLYARGFDADKYVPDIGGLNRPAYIVLPIIGPASTTGVVGGAADSAVSPVPEIENVRARNIIIGVGAVDKREELLAAGDIAAAAALDEYTFVRDASEDRRRSSLAENKVWGR